LRVFINVNGDIQYWIQHSAAGDTWDYGGNLGDGQNVSGPVVGQNADGRLEVFTLDGNNNIRHIWQLSGDGWSGWDSLGGSPGSNPPLSVAQNADGRLEIFELHGNNVWHNWQVVPNGGWSGWGVMAPSDGRANGRPTVIQQSGILNAFVISDGSRIMWNNQQCPNCDFLPYWVWVAPDWMNSWPAAAVDYNGLMEIFAYGANDVVYNNGQDPATGLFGGWNALGQPQ
jgi:hypothetical protein